MRGIFGKLWNRRRGGEPRTVLGRLRHDVRGNTLAIMAAALLPFCGLVGGGIDLSRMYITKTRLQHACDAGALAGRKVMGSGTWGTDDNAAARQYFDANFTSTGMYGSGAATVAFSENAGKVTGTASASLPMTIMQVFGKGNELLSVTCDAEMRLPNTDVLFALDTTGSMACDTNGNNCNGGANSKIAGLRVAVKCFYEIVARLDTDANCTTGTPSGGTGNQVQIRFGFVPYSTNVNVGKLLPTSYFANTWPYQSRRANFNTTNTTTYVQGSDSRTGITTSNGIWYANGNVVSYNGSNYVLGGTYSGACDGRTPRDVAPTFGNEGAPYQQATTQSGQNRITTYKTDATGIERDYDNAVISGVCYYGYRERVVTRTSTWTRTDVGTTTTAQSFTDWRYAKIPDVDISGLKNGAIWNSSFQAPIGTTALGASTAALKTVTWDGCIEERQTTQATNYSPIPSAAKDLDIDLVPNPTDPATLWGPALPDLIFTRNSIIPNLNTAALNLWSMPESSSPLDYRNNSQYFCPTEARKLKSWTDPTEFDTYVDSLNPTGNTYHDIGLLWGARFLSPTGIFSTENAFTSQGGEIDRNLIFMTDGDTVTQNYDYTAYGVAWFDRRQTPIGSVPSSTDLDAQVNARFSALCTAIKNKNITLWVISFGNGSNATTEARLSQCATTGRYFAARDSATLQATFASIANQISQLRLTR